MENLNDIWQLKSDSDFNSRVNLIMRIRSMTYKDFLERGLDFVNLLSEQPPTDSIHWDVKGSELVITKDKNDTVIKKLRCLNIEQNMRLAVLDCFDSLRLNFPICFQAWHWTQDRLYNRLYIPFADAARISAPDITIGNFCYPYIDNVVKLDNSDKIADFNNKMIGNKLLSNKLYIVTDGNFTLSYNKRLKFNNTRVEFTDCTKSDYLCTTKNVFYLNLKYFNKYEKKYQPYHENPIDFSGFSSNAKYLIIRYNYNTGPKIQSLINEFNNKAIPEEYLNEFIGKNFTGSFHDINKIELQQTDYLYNFYNIELTRDFNTKTYTYKCY